MGPRSYLMCRPTYFDVTYSINPWMDPAVPTDTALACRQWEGLVAAYREAGHTVELIEPDPAYPDMVFAANGGLVVDGLAMGAHFRNAQRVGEGPLYQAWLAARYEAAAVPVAVNEGEGDYLVVGEWILAGTGFRSEPASHAEVQELFGHPVIRLQLVDPRFYHLDTALAVLSDRLIAYWPQAFSPGSQAVLRRLFPEAILVGEAEAVVLGLNAVSDGERVFVAAQAVDFAGMLAERGLTPVPVDLSELLKSGGGIKCCTLELRPVR